jgi:acetyl-CoA acetyltransferase/uncharacterized OB-fold protein
MSGSPPVAERRPESGRSGGKAVPQPTPETAPYWEGTARGELRLPRCDRCAHYFFYPRAACPRCASTAVSWVTASGRARLHTYLITHRPAPGFDERAPYAIAVVQLDEGPRLMTNIVGVDNTPEALELDMLLEVSFEPRGDQYVPVFRPARTPGQLGDGKTNEPRTAAGDSTDRATNENRTRRPPRAANGIRGKVAIVGAAETEAIGVVPNQSALELHAEAARRAVADAGMSLGDVDGVASAGTSPATVAHHLGITPTYLDGTTLGGCSFLLHVRHAAAAITAGLADVVLVTHGQSGRSRVGVPRRSPDPSSPQGQFEAPFGTAGAPTLFPIGVLRYMKEFGLTDEQLASVAVAQRKWSADVPRAMYREPISVDDVLSSRLVSYPLHLLECCLVTDGGGALVITSAERARARPGPKPPVFVLGTGEASETPLISTMEDFTTSLAFRNASAAAFTEAGIGPGDVDHLMVYDAFAHLPLYGLEDLGFVGRGEAGTFVAEGHTSPGGRLPMNTNGGGLSYTHTGMYGMFLIQESVRQLRKEAAAQVPGVEVSVAQGVGGMFMAAGTLVLGTTSAAGHGHTGG